MDVRSALERHGGFSSRAALIQATSRADVDGALRRGEIVRVGLGRYAFAESESAAQTAHATTSVLCLTSAALHHGWPVKTTPTIPHLSIGRHRKVPPGREHVGVWHYADLGPDDIVDGVATSREITLAQCLRCLPDDEALCVADSALRAGEHATLARVLASARGAGRAKMFRIGGEASEAAANPFESCLRAISLTVPGVRFRPQFVIDDSVVWARVDLADPELGLIVEADSFEFHANREGFRKDVRRYTLLTSAGWIVLRFTWEDVMLRPRWVRETLVRTVSRLRCVTELAEPTNGWLMAA